MKPQQTILSAAGASDWIPVNHRGNDFGIGFTCGVDSNWNATYSIEHSLSNPEANLAATFGQSTTTITVTLTNHGLTTSDSVILSGTRETGVEGHFEVATVADANTFTVTSGTSQTVTAGARVKVSPMKVFAHDTVNAKTTADDGGYDLPCRAVRANITTYTAGVLTVDWVFND